MRGLRPLLCAAALALAWSPARAADTLVQFSTLDALIHGVYDGPFTFSQIGRYGDFGLGTFNGLDGEMVGLDGVFYRIGVDGTAHVVDGATRSPFAVVTFFHPAKTVPLHGIGSLAALEEVLDRETGSPNLFYAIRIRGAFAKVAARSVVRQQPPYQPLTMVVKGQAVFALDSIHGTLVGFRCPPYVRGINVPGYHLHFLSDDHRHGGHILDCAIADGVAEIETLDTFRMFLPRDAAFLDADLSAHDEEAVRKVEKMAAPGK